MKHYSAALTRLATQHGWRFGVGQSTAQERAEIATVQATGLTYAYMAAQELHRSLPFGLPAPRSRPSRIEQERSRRRSVTQETRGQESALAEVVEDGAREAASGPGDEAEMRALLRAVGDGQMEVESAVLPPLPTDADRTLVRVAEFAALVIGLHREAGMPGHAMVACRFVTEYTGIPHKTAARKLRDLVEAGVLAAEEPMPGTRTGRFSAGGVEPVGAEPVPTLGVAAPDAGALVDRAVAQAQVGTRNATGFWLACQLRDHGHDERAATCALEEFRARVPSGGDPYTAGEASKSVRSAYSRSARLPWTRR